jgi:ABC-type glycerol-3-phosphate transport system substrate-binding protein
MPRTILLAVMLALAAPLARAQGEVRLWHALDPALGRELEDLAARFNAAQREFRIVLDRADSSLFARPDLQRLALPMNTARPVLYYNRDAFRRAGLDPQAPPHTWYEMARALGSLSDAGQKCGYTTAWPSWVLLGSNGGELDRQLLVRWVSMLASWQKSGYFSHSGRLDEAEARFAGGECAVLTASSASWPELAKRAAFELGVAPLPRYEDFSAAASLPAGSPAVWAASRSVGVAKFFAFLAGHAAEARRRREAIDQALEAVWSGARTPVDALSLVKY